MVNAAADVSPEESPSASISARVIELSLHGCQIESPSPFARGAPVFVKIFHENEYFEAKGTVIYVNSDSVMGVEFRDLKPHCRVVLQKWILAALRRQSTAK